MHVGVAMFCTDYSIAPAKLATALEERGFESLWLPEHSHIPLSRLSPFPGAWCELPGAGRIKILRSTRGEVHGPPGTVLDERLTVACGDGAVRIVELQRAGGRPMRTEEFLRGIAVEEGDVVRRLRRFERRDLPVETGEPRGRVGQRAAIV